MFLTISWDLFFALLLEGDIGTRNYIDTLKDVHRIYCMELYVHCCQCGLKACIMKNAADIFSTVQALRTLFQTGIVQQNVLGTFVSR